jgi:hypothetical protein
MCQQFIANRNALKTLIFTLGSFNRQDLERRFTRARGKNALIDGSRTIRDFLEEFTEMGVLQKCGDDTFRVVFDPNH